MPRRGRSGPPTSSRTPSPPGIWSPLPYLLRVRLPHPLRNNASLAQSSPPRSPRLSPRSPIRAERARKQPPPSPLRPRQEFFPRLFTPPIKGPGWDSPPIFLPWATGAPPSPPPSPPSEGERQRGPPLPSSSAPRPRSATSTTRRPRPRPTTQYIKEHPLRGQRRAPQGRASRPRPTAGRDQADPRPPRPGQRLRPRPPAPPP